MQQFCYMLSINEHYKYFVMRIIYVLWIRREYEYAK